MLLASGSLWLREPLVLNCIGTLEPVILAYQCSYYYYYYLGNVVTLITFLNSYFKKHEYQGRIFLYVKHDSIQISTCGLGFTKGSQTCGTLCLFYSPSLRGGIGSSSFCLLPPYRHALPLCFIVVTNDLLILNFLCVKSDPKTRKSRNSHFCCYTHVQVIFDP